MAEHNRLPANGRGGDVVRRAQFQQTIHQGPLPAPESFAAYERVLPGAADRILKMAEQQATHRQGLERSALNGDIVKSMMGTILAYLTFGGAMVGAVYLLLHDKPIQSLAALVTALGAAFGPKVYADFIRPKPEDHDPAPPQLSERN
jgi:uncharacterized membrane protein